MIKKRRRFFADDCTCEAHFTLTELVVVIGIVLLLTSFLIPSLLRVREEARAVVCLNGIRNLGLAFGYYTNDYNYYFPHEDFGSSKAPHNQCWYQVLDKYIPTDPTYKAKQDPRYEQLHSDDISKLGHSYKMNSRLEEYKGTKSSASLAFRRITSIKNISETVLIFDGRCDKSTYRSKAYGMYTSVEGRHLNKAAILFTDFHCKLVDGPTDENTHWTGPGGLYWDPDVSLEKQ